MIVSEQPNALTLDKIDFTNPSNLPKTSALAKYYKNVRSSIGWASLSNSWDEMVECVKKDLEIYRRDTLFEMGGGISKYLTRGYRCLTDINKETSLILRNRGT